MAMAWIVKGKPYLAMVLQQFGLVGMYLITKATLDDGMNQYVLVVYRNIIGAAVIAPFAFFLERKRLPRITGVVFFKILALAFLDPVLQQNLFYEGVKLTTASFASALETLIPATTYLMALALRLEKLEIKQGYGQAKFIGTLVNVAGAAVLILYKGPILQFPWYSKRAELHSSTEDPFAHGAGTSDNWIKGTFCIIGSSSFWSAFLLLQSNTLESFPAGLTLTALICLLGAVMGAAVALVMEQGNASVWFTDWDKSKFFVAAYTGIICTGISYYLQGVVMKERGPVFASAFGPISIFFTAILGSFFLSENITFGMTLGVIIMVAGRYALLWGKANDKLFSHKILNPVKQELPITVSTSNDIP